MMRTRSSQWDGDPWEQSKKHDAEKKIIRKNIQSYHDLRVCVHIIPDLYKSKCCNFDSGDQFMVLYHAMEIVKQDWRFCDMKVYAHSIRDLYNYAQVKNFLDKVVVHGT